MSLILHTSLCETKTLQNDKEDFNIIAHSHPVANFYGL